MKTLEEISGGVNMMYGKRQMTLIEEFAERVKATIDDIPGVSFETLDFKDEFEKLVCCMKEKEHEYNNRQQELAYRDYRRLEAENKRLKFLLNAIVDHYMKKEEESNAD